MHTGGLQPANSIIPGLSSQLRWLYVYVVSKRIKKYQKKLSLEFQIWSTLSRPSFVGITYACVDVSSDGVSFYVDASTSLKRSAYKIT